MRALQQGIVTANDALMEVVGAYRPDLVRTHQLPDVLIDRRSHPVFRLVSWLVSNGLISTTSQPSSWGNVIRCGNPLPPLQGLGVDEGMSGHGT